MSYSLLIVCPTTTITNRNEALTGSTVEVQTVVRTKPRPPGDSINISASVSGEALRVNSDNVVYSIPDESNTYLFVHVIKMPQSKITESDVVFGVVNFSNLPTDSTCSGAINQPIDRITLIQG